MKILIIKNKFITFHTEYQQHFYSTGLADLKLYMQRDRLYVYKCEE